MKTFVARLKLAFETQIYARWDSNQKFQKASKGVFTVYILLVLLELLISLIHRLISLSNFKKMVIFSCADFLYFLFDSVYIYNF